MDVTFGAVGDFISVGLLIKDLVELLDDTRGSAWEYQTLIQQLNILRRFISQAEAFCTQHCTSPDLADTRDALRDVTGEASRRLEAVAVKVKKYTNSLEATASGNASKKASRKIQWKMESKEIERFRIDIERYTSLIQSLLVTATGRLMQNDYQNLKQLVERLQDQSKGRFDSVDNQLHALKTQSANTQEFLAGFGWIITDRMETLTKVVSRVGNGISNGASILLTFAGAVTSALLRMETLITGIERPLGHGAYFTFEDYTGAVFTISLTFIDSWDTFDSSLAARFRGKKGGRRVANHRYLLQHPETGDDIGRDLRWEIAAAPGRNVKMILSCEMALDTDDGQSELQRCPFCKEECEGVPGEVVECSSCNQFFRKLDGIEGDENVPQAPSAPAGILGTGARDANEIANAGSEAKPSRQKKWAHLRKTPRPDPSGYDSDSDEEDLTGLKNIAVVPKKALPRRSSISTFDATTLSSDDQQDLSTSLTSTDENEIDDGIHEDADPIVRTAASKELPGDITTSWVKHLRKAANLTGREKAMAPLEDEGDDPERFVSLEETPSVARAFPHFRHGQATAYINLALNQTKEHKGKMRLFSVPRATDSDAREHRIPKGYSLDHWDPRSEPILLLGSVFDHYSIGRWIFDWTVHHYGRSGKRPHLAGDLWRDLLDLVACVEILEQQLPLAPNKNDREILDDLIESGHRLTTKFRRILKACEEPMLRTGWGGTRTDEAVGEPLNTGLAFLETFFGWDAELPNVESFMLCTRLWLRRLDANCGRLLIREKRVNKARRKHTELPGA